MSDVERKRPRKAGDFAPGQSGNPAGRPKAAVAASEIARGLVKKYQIFERLARTAAGQAQPELRAADGTLIEAAGPLPTISEQTNAQKLLLAYGYGTPVQMVEGAGATGPREVKVVINYVDRQLVQNAFVGDNALPAEAASGSGESLERSTALELRPDGAQMGEVDAGPAPADS